MIQEILQSINQLLAMDGPDDVEKTQLLANSSDSQLQALSGKLSTRDVLIIATIGSASPFRQKSLHEKVNTSQPTISRAVERLTKLGLLTRSRMPNNKKEWQLALTALGQKVAAAKQALDQETALKAQKIASRYTEAELAKFNEFIQQIITLRKSDN